MNSKMCLWLCRISSLATCVSSNKSTFLWTLFLSVFFLNPSFADNELTNDAHATNSTLSNGANRLNFAQKFLMPSSDKAATHTISDCTALNKFEDDGGVSGYLYIDTIARLDTITLCPNSIWQTVKVEFTDFDLADGDTLSVYDGDLAAFQNQQAPFIGKRSGVGASIAFGGWVAAACSPAINPTGCLTFTFKTNGDNGKGNGWTSWVTCQDRNLKIEPPSIANPLLKCDEAYASVTVNAAAITAACGTIADDSTIVQIRNSSGVLCVDTVLSKNKNMSVTKPYAIGTYLVTYQLKADPTKTVQTYFSVNARNLVCNDQLEIPFGSACAIRITPDMILESPCDSIQDTLYYQLKIKDFSGKILAAGTGKAGDYPIINKDQLNGCNNTFRVEVTRVYYDGLNLTICNNGRQEATCSANVAFVDNTPPFFTEGISTDTVYACEPNLSAEGLLLTPPKVVDNCSDASVVFQNATKISSGNDCAITTYLVTWLAKDNCNNQATLKDTVRVMRPGLDKIIDAPDVVLSCGEDNPNDAQNLAKTGVPSLLLGIQKNGVFTPTDTIPLSTEEYVCKYILSSRDQQFPSTCGQKFFRYWTILDWCGTIGPMPLDTQFITFKDTLAPVLECSNYNSLAAAEVIPLAHFDCSKNVVFPASKATDNCDLLPEVAMYTVEVLEADGWWKKGNNLNETGALPTGTYRVGYRAYDQCHEQIKEDSCFRYFILEDQTKPSAVCQDELTVSISNDQARIFATDIDAGSWDACGVERILVRRRSCDNPDSWQGAINNYVKERLGKKLDPNGWANYVDFACCDIHQKVKVELLVIDRNGNYNYCWMNVNAEDKISPICANLAKQWDYCDNFHTGELGALTDTDKDKNFDTSEWLPLEGDLADTYNQKYGTPYAACVDNLTCQELVVEQQYQLIDLGCGVYKAIRRYRVKDWTGNTSNWAEQYINIEYRPDWKFIFPVDWTGTCGDAVPKEELIIQNGYCDQVGYESYDQTFEIVNDACFKVIRTYHIINWCKYQAGDTPIKINRIENAKGEVTAPQTITSEQYGSASYFTYTQVLKVDDRDAPVVEVAPVETCIENENACSATKTFAASAVDCNAVSSSNLDYQWEIFENGVSRGSGFNQAFTWTVQPDISYIVKWKVADKCGNSSWVEKAYTFKDCYKPTAYCLSGLTLEMGANQEVVIWASDFNLNSFDNCTVKDKLTFKMWHESLPVAPPSTYEEVAALPSSVSFNCTYLGLQTIHMYVVDEAGNYDFCVTTLAVQDNMGACPLSGGMLAGKIYTEFGAAVENVEVRVENMDNTMMMTESSGGYNFEVDGSANYRVVPSKNQQVLNGVSTFDMVKITKHILGKEKFTSPYQYIAADVNNSGDVSTFDIIQLRKLILNLITAFPDNQSWRFVDASYEFTEANPAAETFPEYIQVNNLRGTMPDLDFIAVKIGDINGSASVNSLMTAEDRTKTASLNIEIADRMVQAGEVVDVEFTVRDFQHIDGYQFTLVFKELELLDFKEGVATVANIGFGLQEKGYLVTSWHNTTIDENQATDQLFRLTFKAKTSGSLLSLIQLNSAITTAEAYRNDGTLLDVTLQPSIALSTTFDLRQNTPNPFAEHTTITFELPKAAAVTLNVLDIQGKVIKTQTGDFEGGVQRMNLNANELQNGTYYYQLVTPFGVATKKMIVLK